MEVIMTIGLAPVTKKNSQQILKNAGTGRPFIAPSRAYREYAEAASSSATTGVGCCMTSRIHGRRS